MTAPIGTLIRERRKDLGLSQQDLARVLGFSQSQVSKMESNQTEVSMDLLAKICDYLDAEVSDFVSVTESDSAVWYGYETLVHLKELSDAGQYAEMLRVIDRAIGAQFFQQHRHNAVRLLYWKTVAFVGLLDRDSTIQMCDHLLNEYTPAMDASLMARIYVSYATAYLISQDGAKAHYLIKKALDICNANPAVKSDTELMRTIEYTHGSAFFYLDELDRAATAYARASFLDDTLVFHVVHQAALCVNRSGDVASRNGKYGEAVLLYREALRKWEFIGYVQFTLVAKKNVACALRMMGCKPKSERMYLELVEFCREHPGVVYPGVREHLESLGYKVD